VHTGASGVPAGRRIHRQPRGRGPGNHAAHSGIILIVSPSNPTGAVYDEKTLRALADLAVGHDIWLLTDDIYRCLCYGDARFVQPATFSPEVRKRTIIGGRGFQGLCHDWVAYRFLCGASAVIEGMSTLQGQSTTNAAAVSQAAAVAALEGPTDELERMRLEFDKRRQYMVKTLRAMPGSNASSPRAPSMPSLTSTHSWAGARLRARSSTVIRPVRVLHRRGQGGGGSRISLLCLGLRAPVVRHFAANIEKGLTRIGEALAKLK